MPPITPELSDTRAYLTKPGFVKNEGRQKEHFLIFTVSMRHLFLENLRLGEGFMYFTFLFPERLSHSFPTAHFSKSREGVYKNLFGNKFNFLSALSEHLSSTDSARIKKPGG